MYAINAVRLRSARLRASSIVCLMQFAMRQLLLLLLGMLMLLLLPCHPPLPPPFPLILTSQGNQQSKSKQSSPMSNANVTLPHPAYLPSESIVLFLIKPQPPSLSASLLPPPMPACHPPTAVHWSLRVICAAASARLGRC